MTTEPEYTAPAPFPEAGYVQFQIPGLPYSVVRLPLVWNIDEFNILVASAMESAKLVKEAYDEAFPPSSVPSGYAVDADVPGGQSPPPRVQQQPQRVPQQRAQQQRGGQDRETRASKFPLMEGWECDLCGGPVGRRPATGNMKGDAAVCLGTCKDDNKYVHTVEWNL